MGNVLITRTSQYANRMRKINLYSNNNKIASIKNGETLEIELEEDNYLIYAKIDWCKTNPIEVTVTKESNIELEVGSELSPFNLLSNLYHVFIKTSGYIYLKEI